MPTPDATTPDATTPAVDPALLTALRALEESVHESGLWGLDPQIFLWQPPVMAGMMIQAAYWQRSDGHPADILEMIAGQWDDVKAGLIAQDPVVFGQPPQGLVIISEAWSLDIGAALESGDHEKAAQYRTAAQNRTVHKHPDRQEVRTVAAVDANLAQISIVRWRAKDEAKEVFDGVDGLMSDAMKAFVTRVTARYPV